MRISFLFSAGLLVVAACAPARSTRRELNAPRTDPSVAALRDSILDVDAGRRATDVRAWLAPDALYIADGTPILRGAGAAAPYLTPPDDSVTVRWEPLGALASRDGRSAVTYGMSLVVGKGGRGDVSIEHYVAWWQRIDGRWRVAAYADLGASVAAPPQASDGSDADLGLDRRAASPAALAAMNTDAEFSNAAAARDISETFAMYADRGAVAFTGSALRFGPEEMAASRTAMDGRVLFSWRPLWSDASPTGDLAVTIGRYTLTGKVSKRSVTGKYFTVWKQQPDGRWRYVFDGGNADPHPR